MSKYENISHDFEPVFNEHSKVLILGTIPSVKSRENNFYYGHPQNRFWKVISHITNSTFPNSKEEKIDMLLKNNIAIWDVLKSCQIKGSSDNSIKNPIVNDLSFVLNKSQVNKIFVNGKKANELYNKYCFSQTNIDCVCLPSTSPANAVWTFKKLVACWEKELIT